MEDFSLRQQGLGMPETQKIDEIPRLTR